MKSLGKMMVEDDIHDLGLYDYYNRKGHIDHPSKIHHWQLGLGVWYASEMLSLVNFFFPFTKQIEKNKLQQEVNRLEQLQINYSPKKKIQAQQNPFRNMRERY
jgi:hypothetical protein